MGPSLCGAGEPFNRAVPERPATKRVVSPAPGAGGVANRHSAHTITRNRDAVEENAGAPTPRG